MEYEDGEAVGWRELLAEGFIVDLTVGSQDGSFDGLNVGIADG